MAGECAIEWPVFGYFALFSSTNAHFARYFCASLCWNLHSKQKMHELNSENSGTKQASMLESPGYTFVTSNLLISFSPRPQAAMN
jgi:hypothetical protein